MRQLANSRCGGKGINFHAMEWSITLAVMAVFGGITAFAGWKAGKPRKDSLNPRFISWPVIAVLAAVVLVFAAIHALNLMGMHTGARTLSRYGA